jgi:hypothetical protein
MLSVREICTSFQEIFADVAIKDGRRHGEVALPPTYLVPSGYSNNVST